MSVKGVVQLTTMSDGRRTVTEAALHTYRYPSLVAHGSSGTEPGDRSRAAVGEALATARALRALAARLERQANGTVKHAEDMRRHRAEIVCRADEALREDPLGDESPSWSPPASKRKPRLPEG